MHICNLTRFGVNAVFSVHLTQSEVYEIRQGSFEKCPTSIPLTVKHESSCKIRAILNCLLLLGAGKLYLAFFD